MGASPKVRRRTGLGFRPAPSKDVEAAIRLGATLPGVERTTTWGAPALTLRGKLVACQAINKEAEPGSLVVRVPSAHVDELIAADPDTYYLKPHYEGYNAVLVRVSRIHTDALRDLLLMACRFVDATTKRRGTGRRTTPRARTGRSRSTKHGSRA